MTGKTAITGLTEVPSILTITAGKSPKAGWQDVSHPASPPLGTYETITGIVEIIDPIFRRVSICDGSTKIKIFFDDLKEISEKEVVNIDEFLGLQIMKLSNENVTQSEKSLFSRQNR